MSSRRSRSSGGKPAKRRRPVTPVLPVYPESFREVPKAAAARVAAAASQSSDTDAISESSGWTKEVIAAAASSSTDSKSDSDDDEGTPKDLLRVVPVPAAASSSVTDLTQALPKKLDNKTRDWLHEFRRWRVLSHNKSFSVPNSTRAVLICLLRRLPAIPREPRKLDEMCEEIDYILQFYYEFGYDEVFTKDHDSQVTSDDVTNLQDSFKRLGITTGVREPQVSEYKKALLTPYDYYADNPGTRMARRLVASDETMRFTLFISPEARANFWDVYVEDESGSMLRKSKVNEGSFGTKYILDQPLTGRKYLLKMEVLSGSIRSEIEFQKQLGDPRSRGSYWIPLAVHLDEDKKIMYQIMPYLKPLNTIPDSLNERLAIHDAFVMDMKEAMDRDCFSYDRKLDNMVSDNSSEQFKVYHIDIPCWQKYDDRSSFPYTCLFVFNKDYRAVESGSFVATTMIAHYLNFLTDIVQEDLMMIPLFHKPHLPSSMVVRDDRKFYNRCLHPVSGNFENLDYTFKTFKKHFNHPSVQTESAFDKLKVFSATIAEPISKCYYWAYESFKSVSWKTSPRSLSKEAEKERWVSFKSKFTAHIDAISRAIKKEVDDLNEVSVLGAAAAAASSGRRSGNMIVGDSL